jgi:hypothetical protein
MGSDGQEAVDLQQQVEGHHGACIAPGCGCRDGRIVSPRRAQFHAFLARERGETADRLIAPDPEWRLPNAASEEM